MRTPEIRVRLPVFLPRSVGVLCEKLDFGLSAIVEEILTDSILDDEKRLGEIVAETKVQDARCSLKSGGTFGGSDARASSYFSADIGYYDDMHRRNWLLISSLKRLAKHFEEKKGEVIAKLKETAARLFTKENMLISYTAAAGSIRQGLKQRFRF